MNTISANTLTPEILAVQSLDNNYGDDLQVVAKLAMVPHMEELLFELENEILTRDSNLKIIDAELKRNIQIIEHLYKSYRYRIGGFLIRPVEVVLFKLASLTGTKVDSNFNTDIGKRTD